MKGRLIILLFIALNQTYAQGIFDNKLPTSRQDTLRGSITPERAWWDLTYYHLDIKVEPDKKYISGSNTVGYKVLQSSKVMQIDLQKPMNITSITSKNKELKFTREGNAYFIELRKKPKKGDIDYIKINYEGFPKEAIRAPWDGGLSWKKDENNNHFIATSCQGLGASVWWPNKDHMYDEVDSMLISVNVPKNLTNVSNGRLKKITELDDDTRTFDWFVTNPINNYGVNINIGDYVNFSEVYKGEKGDLDIDNYVLSYNLEKAKEQFKQVPMMIEAFEHWFGPYPFYEDSFKMVEVPYLGMEHQSSITYGNKFQNGYLGRDLSGSGWGLKFDYIIIHEGGHEWFANNITYKDVADMWVHEGFTCYSENLYVDYFFGKDASAEYVIGTRRGISNKKPIIGEYDVNREGSSDMYSKGANLLHTIRQLANNDELWRQTLRGLNEEFYHSTVTTREIEEYISNSIGMDLSKVFDQYLRDYRIPMFEYEINNGVLSYRWNDVIEGFDMPIEVKIDGETKLLQPTNKFQKMKIKNLFINMDNDYYVYSKDLKVVVQN
ncbi:MAG: M1 family peptidase [Candidatus Pelagibacter sp. TMED153]|nr:MAG: M1 family peptidase [Candidatus Pelagibacter sp. TMED153]|tara:strand:+ start:257 stop:1909 length:1653 start_codon:yes stop_codon:yes gene_type:complete